MNYTPGIGQRLGMFVFGLVRLAMLVGGAWLMASMLATAFVMNFIQSYPPINPLSGSERNYITNPITRDEAFRQVQADHSGLFWKPGAWIFDHTETILVIGGGMVGLIVLVFFYDYLRWGDALPEERNKKNNTSPHTIH